jgi:hypothetical protein
MYNTLSDLPLRTISENSSFWDCLLKRDGRTVNLAEHFTQLRRNDGLSFDGMEVPGIVSFAPSGGVRRA